MTNAAFFSSNEEDKTINCNLCPCRCTIQNGYFGACKVRGNKNGKGLIPFYGAVSALALDPIEKKPLFHFRPGSKILSAGFTGCNMRCPFCQNWQLSQAADVAAKKMLPGDIVSAALHAAESPQAIIQSLPLGKRTERTHENSQAIAYTYSEPLVHIEFLLDCMALAKRHGIANVLVTHGCVNEEAAKEILPLTSAANIDLKCFSKET
ncbi:MAG: radical SAM protein, partial [Treponema sp.]|nr:radical SAM protein [Treponema sp.]